MILYYKNMGNCFSKKKLKTNLTESVFDEYKLSLPSKLSTIAEEKNNRYKCIN